ncbi:MAG: nuclear transport factor 2 family protein [Planctomycetes bacterium]|nr:nuclear transport factor 2 family protein [Planctomycetota bacterium]
MAEIKPLLAAETETVRQVYAALNRNDVAAMVKAFDPQIERIEPSDSPHGGIYHGLDAVKAHIARARETWAEGECDPERLIATGDKVVAIINVRVRLKHENEWRQGRTVDVFTFRDGKAIQFRTFFDEQQGLQWAGVKDSGR